MYLSSPILVATLARLALLPMDWTSRLPVPEASKSIMFSTRIGIRPCTFRLSGRVPVTIDGGLEYGVADQREVLVRPSTVGTSAVERFVEEVDVLEGVAEGGAHKGVCGAVVGRHVVSR